MNEVAESPHTDVETQALAGLHALEAKGQRVIAPAGDGAMVWRMWGKGTPLVLLHGGYGSWGHWVRNIEPLAQRYQVFAPDLPGLGQSAMPNDPTPQRVADIVARSIAALLPGDAGFHLVGFSFGGLVGGAVAAICGARLRSFTLVGSGPAPAQRSQRVELIRVTRDMTASEIAATQRANLSRLMLYDPASIDDLALALQTQNTRVARLKSIGFHPPDWHERNLPHVTAPLGAIWGEFDSTGYPELDDRKRRLQAIRPDATFKMIPGVGHWVQYEAADVFNRVLIDRLDALS